MGTTSYRIPQPVVNRAWTAFALRFNADLWGKENECYGKDHTDVEKKRTRFVAAQVTGEYLYEIGRDKNRPHQQRTLRDVQAKMRLDRWQYARDHAHEHIRNKMGARYG